MPIKNLIDTLTRGYGQLKMADRKDFSKKIPHWLGYLYKLDKGIKIVMN